MSRQSFIQVLLIVATLAVAWRLLVGSGQRTQAVRRIGLLVLAALAVYSIIDPSGTWTRVARWLGIGRGADLILYGLVVAFLGFVVTTYKRFRAMETRYTRLARRIALDEVPPPESHPALAADPSRETDLPAANGVTSATTHGGGIPSTPSAPERVEGTAVTRTPPTVPAETAAQTRAPDAD